MVEIIFDGGGFADPADSNYMVSEIGFKNPDGQKLRYSTEISCKMGIRGLFLLGLRRFRRCFVSGKWERAKTAKDDPYPSDKR